MQSERTFFERLAGASQPDWDIKLQPHMQPGQLDLASYSALIYVVDTSTGWTSAGAMQPDSFAAAAKAHADLGLSAEAIAELAGQTIARLGREQPAADAPDVAKCIQAVAAALTATQTFAQVRTSGDLSGHWVFLAYRMHDASTITRPVFFRTGSSDFLPTAALD